MKFFPLKTEYDDSLLHADMEGARSLGHLFLGNDFLFVKKRFKVYYIPYSDIGRAFRRVELVRATLCCGKGSLEVENLVISDRGDIELVQVQMPGERAGKAAIAELKEKAPGASFKAPPKAGNADGTR